MISHGPFRAPRRQLVGVAAAAVLALAGVAGPALAQSNGDNSAVAVNTRDGATIFRFAFSVRQVMGEVVDQSNTAVAYASCEECQTVAIAVQMLLVSGSPDEVTPTNLAVALNEECQDCQTLAAAYQFVFGTGEELRFTAEGRRKIADIRRRFLGLRQQDLSIEETQARTDELADELRQVLASEVTTRGSGKAESDDEARESSEEAGRADSDPPPEKPTDTTGTTTAPPPTTSAPPPTTTAPPRTQTAPSQTQPAPESTETAPTEP